MKDFKFISYKKYMLQYLSASHLKLQIEPIDISRKFI